ncbi:MAG: helix-turn-helix domain-containing protein, partial [Actinomycetia bacterium]|nr:helix-turn-helix domain-containing protein [Actinomycetes bacterium]
LDAGGNLEAASRALFVHPNTVRYRLGRIIEKTGYDLADPHDAFTVRIALALSRLPRGARAPSGL